MVGDEMFLMVTFKHFERINLDIQDERWLLCNEK